LEITVGVSQERIAQIRELSNDERVDRTDTSAFTQADWERFSEELNDETLAFCRENRDAEELHAFANTYHWDKGIWALDELLRNPACEAATALFIYWRAAPEYYRQFANRDEVPSFQREDFDFVAALERRYVAGEFPKGVLGYDPSSPDHNDGTSMVGEYDKYGLSIARTLPPVMYEPVEPKHLGD
jgi:Domain of unknown function (DUF4274)